MLSRSNVQIIGLVKQTSQYDLTLKLIFIGINNCLYYVINKVYSSQSMNGMQPLGNTTGGKNKECRKKQKVDIQD